MSHPTQQDEAQARGDTGPATGQHPAAGRMGWIGMLGGVGLLALAVVFVIGGLDLGMGTARRLGTGAFPVLSGLTLAILCFGIILGDFRDGQLQEVPDWVSFAAIGAALAIFAFTAERYGLVPAVFLATLTASLPDRSLAWAGKLALGCGVALGSWGLFIGILDLPFRAIVGI